MEILKVHSKHVKMDETVDLEALGLATSGAVGADLANMINEAAILAVKNGRKAICQKDLFEAMEVVLMGKEKKDRILSTEERKIVSYHEVGPRAGERSAEGCGTGSEDHDCAPDHGRARLCAADARGGKYLLSKKEIEARLVVCLGGRAAEEIVFDTVTTGASNDIEQATRLARAMVTQYGMSEKFGLIGLETRESMYLNNGTVLNCSDQTATDVDSEVMRILRESYDEAKRLLLENRTCLDKIAEFLIERNLSPAKSLWRFSAK